MTILAIDPGETTGWCLWRPGAEYRGMRHIERFGQISAKVDINTKPDAVYQELNRVARVIMASVEMRQITGNPIAHIVIEDFTFRGGHRIVKTDIITIKMVGMLLYGAAQTGVSYSTQIAGDAKGVITDMRLKRWGYWLPHKERHARDAIRHALLYERKNR